MSSSFPVVSLAAIVLLVVPAGADTVRDAVDAGNATYIRAMADGDADLFGACYDEGGARLHAGGTVTRGRDAVVAEVAEFLAEVGSVSVTIETLELWVVDDLAHESGKWTYAYTRPGHEERRVGGIYVTVWKRQDDGGWKIFSDMSVPETTSVMREGKAIE
jgi:uncharacterized protein (TIGR02246 family)